VKIHHSLNKSRSGVKNAKKVFLFSYFSRHALDLLFEFLAGVKSHNSARFDGNGFSCAGVSPRARRFGADLEITKA
jgi:hypothetical protein